MFSLLEGIRSALASIRAHGMRSFLTSLGIIIGVASVIAVVSIVQGMSKSITDQFAGLGSDTITVTAFTPRDAQLAGQRAKLTDADLQVIAFNVEGIEQITPTAQLGGGTARYRDSDTLAQQIFGTTASYVDLYDLYPRVGRFITPQDEQSRRPVVILGEDVRENLNLPEDPIGEFIQVFGEWFKVVGVVEPRGDLLGFSQDNFIMMPYSTARRILGEANEPNIIVQLNIGDIAQLPAVRDQMTRELRRARDLAPEEPDDFRIQTPDQLLESFNAVVGVVTAVSGGVVGISLLVGGIGIMNIMLVSVTERTREIGILKALGAQRGDILLQFLIEAVTLCLLGGLVGLLLGYGLGAAVAAMLPGFPAASVPTWAIFLGLGFSAGVGILFGIIPAAKAANLHPIDALRYE